MEIPLPVAAAVLGAALLHAAWNALVKSSADKELDTVAVAVGSGALALAMVPWLPSPAPASWPWLAGSALVHILYFAFVAGAYRWGDLSYAYPIMRGGGPLIVAIVGALLLGEVLHGSQWSGVALLSAGILAFAAGRHDRRATLFALGNAVVIAAYTLIDARGARVSEAPVSYAVWFFAANGLVIGSIGFARRGAQLSSYLRRHWGRAAVGGAFALGAYGIVLWAVTQAPVALVAALRETSVVFGALLGALFLGEKLTRRRIAATGAVLGGMVLLRL